MGALSKNIIIVFWLFVSVIPAFAQKDLVIGQYIHNRYALNTAFAGNREVLSLFGSYRKKWAGFNGSPNSQFFSAHTPLRNENIALGFELYNQNYGVSGQTGFVLSYTYRLQMSNNKKLAFSINGGGSSYSNNWSEVSVLNEQVSDPQFAGNESSFAPVVGFGSAWYSEKFFLGLSVPNFFYYDSFVEGGESSFDLNKANYILTGGYLFSLAKRWHLQPSVMAHYNPSYELITDFSTTVIYNNMLWLGAGYRSTDDIVAMFGYQVTPQLRFSYSYDYNAGDISTYNNGTHEVAIQFDFGYKVKTPNPKFF